MLKTLLLNEAPAQNKQFKPPKDLASEIMYKSVNFLNFSIFIYTLKLQLISCLTAVETQYKHRSVLDTIQALYKDISGFFDFCYLEWVNKVKDL